MDYKNTLNLPRTEFPMKADLVAREPARLEKWQRESLYKQIQTRRSGAPRFVLHDGPPFANGDVHIGTALNKILKDFIVKHRTLRGNRAPYVPGWDCHGLPIEFKVSQELRKTGDTQGDAVKLRDACEAYARKYIALQRTQFKRLGVLGDWENPYLTLDKRYEAEELRLFADIVEKGYVYRGKKPVYWSIPCRTALAEAEVEYQDHVSQSVTVKFPVVGHPGTFLLIWTITPWTLPANLAVAFNSTFNYSLVRAGDELYLVSAVLLPELAKRCGWESYEIVRTLFGDQMLAIEYQHPFCDRRGRLFPGDGFVENTTGTGLVHIAPGHGMEDYSLGLQQGLSIYSPVDDDGCLAFTSDLPADQQMPAALVGKSILMKNGASEANTAVLRELEARGALLHQEALTHSYPHCWRSKTPVVFRAMDQWFIRVDHQGFRTEALKQIRERVDWVPEWGRNRIEAAVKSRPDWCISRQRAWGVPIPAFYDAAANPILDARVIRRVADLVEQHGSNVWFETPAGQLWQRVRPESWEGREATAKSQDTLDVWIDSGSSSRAVLMRRPELVEGGDWQADMYLEGSDQHRGWFQSSLLLSLAGNAAPPFKTVLTHGFMVDADREKISKSKQGQGGYDKPQTADAYVKRHGADVVRLWVASQDCRTDVVVSEERILKVGEIYRLLRNSLRYQLSNLFDYDPAAHAVPCPAMTGLDRWILDAFRALELKVDEAYTRFEFHTVYQLLSQFASFELSAVYHDVVKDRLYTDAANSRRRRSTQTALHCLAGGLAQMLSPILSFTMDEVWEFLPGPDRASSVHLTDWVPGIGAGSGACVLTERETAQWRASFAWREGALAELEKQRQSKAIGKSLDAELVMIGGGPDLSRLVEDRSWQEDLRELFNVSALKVKLAGGEGASDGVTFEALHAAGQKCERCWHWETSVGEDSNHATLCSRCASAVG